VFPFFLALPLNATTFVLVPCMMCVSPRLPSGKMTGWPRFLSFYFAPSAVSASKQALDNLVQTHHKEIGRQPKPPPWTFLTG